MACSQAAIVACPGCAPCTPVQPPPSGPWYSCAWCCGPPEPACRPNASETLHPDACSPQHRSHLSTQVGHDGLCAWSEPFTMANSTDGMSRCKRVVCEGTRALLGKRQHERLQDGIRIVIRPETR